MAWKFYKADGSIITSAVAASTADTATEATNVTAVANNSTDETVYPTFVDGATGTQGIETDTGFTYNPSSGLLTITGELDAGSLDVSGNADIDGTLEADVITIDGTNVVTGSLITHLGTVAAGTWQGTVVAAAYLPDASPTAQGVVELAVGTEVTAGTSTALAVSPDALAGSVAFGTRYVQCVVVASGTDIAEGNGKFFFHIPPGMDTMELIAGEIHARVATAGSGSTVDVQFFLNTSTTNASTGNDMLSTHLTIDDGELDSSTGTAPVVNASYKEVNTNDMIRIDVDGNGGDSTIAKGLIVTLGFRLP